VLPTVVSGESPTSVKPIETTSTTAATVPTITAPTRPGRRRALNAGSGEVCAAGSSGSNPGVSAPRCRPATAQERTETCAQVLPLHPSSHNPDGFGRLIAHATTCPEGCCPHSFADGCRNAERCQVVQVMVVLTVGLGPSVSAMTAQDDAPSSFQAV
jgi:hypothetical protein